MIGQSQVALADVVVIKKDFMSIDFGYFAFVIGHNENGEDEFIPFFGDHYSKDFMVNWVDKVDPAKTQKKSGRKSGTILIFLPQKVILKKRSFIFWLNSRILLEKGTGIQPKDKT